MPETATKPTRRIKVFRKFEGKVEMSVQPVVIAGFRIDGIGLGTAQFALRHGSIEDSIAPFR